MSLAVHVGAERQCKNFIGEAASIEKNLDSLPRASVQCFPGLRYRLLGVQSRRLSFFQSLGVWVYAEEKEKHQQFDAQIPVDCGCLID
jgi:hypothetical protein